MKTISNNRTGRKINRKAPVLKTEYKFDYAKAQPNRFAGRRGKRQVVVLLDPVSSPHKPPEFSPIRPPSIPRSVRS